MDSRERPSLGGTSPDGAQGLQFWIKALGDGHAAAEAEGPAGDFDSGGHLFTFIFGKINKPDNAADGIGVEAFLQDVADAFFLFDVTFDDGVEKIVFGEGVLIFLVGLQFSGTGRLGEGAFGNGWHFTGAGPLRVDVPGKFVDHRFGNVGNHGEPAAHVAIERAIAGGDFAFVSGGEEHVAELIGESHEDVAAEACLHVFLGETFFGSSEKGLESFFHGGVGKFDRNSVEWNSKAVGENLGITPRVIGTVA